MPNDALFARIDTLLTAQLQGVLATQQDAQPYTSLMAFAHTPDLRQLVIATYRDTQKHANLLLNAQVSFLVDDRSNDPADCENATAISASGRAVQAASDERESLLQLYLQKQPQLRAFVTAPECALIRIEVDCYRLISRFQRVELLPIDNAAQGDLPR